MNLFELCDQSEPRKLLKCLVCDKEFKTTKSWRTCGPCKDTQADRDSRQYGETSRKW